jgi:hypothetical protein
MGRSSSWPAYFPERRKIEASWGGTWSSSLQSIRRLSRHGDRRGQSTGGQTNRLRLRGYTESICTFRSPRPSRDWVQRYLRQPMTFDLDEALELRSLVKTSGKVFALTYNYTGYPMVKEAREIVCRGELGKLLKVVTEYPQGWRSIHLMQKARSEPGETTRKRQGPLVVSATSAPTSNIFPGISLDSKSTSCAPTSPHSAQESASRMTQTCSCTTKEGRAVSCTVRTFRREKKID